MNKQQVLELIQKAQEAKYLCSRCIHDAQTYLSQGHELEAHQCIESAQEHARELLELCKQLNHGTTDDRYYLAVWSLPDSLI